MQAVEANDFDADVYIGLTLADDPACQAVYYATPGFESAGGRRLAELLIDCLAHVGGVTVLPARGHWLPILRETRMPAVVCGVGPASLVVERTAEFADAIHEALSRWCASPFEP